MKAPYFTLAADSTARKAVLGVAAVLFVAGLGVNLRIDVPDAAAPVKEEVRRETVVRPLPSDDLDTLAKAVNDEWLFRKESDHVPNAAPYSLPGGLDQMDVAEKKTLFFRSILPHVLQMNKAIRERREKLGEIGSLLESGADMGSADVEFLDRMVDKYRTDYDEFDWDSATRLEAVSELLLRVDEVPPSLVLAQAALESAWGSSRFAIEGNNIFGVWVYNAAKGMIPRGRGEDSNVFVAKYDSITDSVESYFRHLNTLWAYEDFRVIRAKMRQGEESLDSHRLAEGLIQYSERRDEYVQDVVRMIRNNRLTRFDSAQLLDTPEVNPPAEKEEKGVSAKPASDKSDA